MMIGSRWARRAVALRHVSIGSGQHRSIQVRNNEDGYPEIIFKVGAPNFSLPDAFALAAPQLKPLNASMTELLQLSPNSTVPDLIRFSQPSGFVSRPSDLDVLRGATQHFFNLPGKRFRPTIALLAATAANGGSGADARQARLAQIVEMVRHCHQVVQCCQVYLRTSPLSPTRLPPVYPS